MKPLFPAVLFVSFLSFAAPAFAQTPVTPIPRLTPHPTSVPVVVSVDADTITVQNGIFHGMKVTRSEADDSKKSADKKKHSAANVRTYTVTQWTEIKINGHPSKLSDIKPGMQVRVIQGTTPTEASSITVKVDRSVLIPIP